ncbi:MAG: FFLEELY motif protein [Casimicrobium sp.]
MAKPAPDSVEAALREHLNAARSVRARVRGNAQLANDRLTVRTYQQMRMAVTHADLLASPRYAPAARFFLTELYSIKDLTQRDADAERVIRMLVKFLPQKALSTLAAALEMDALSETLDGVLAQHARTTQNDAKPLKLGAEAYARAYVAMARFDERDRQIELTHIIGTGLDKLSRMPLLFSLLKLMRAPARSAGVGELHKFLENGYAAFTHMKGGKEFIEGIVARERAEHERILAEA